MKIVIADDSSLWRERIKTLLNCFENISVVGEVENGAEAMRIIMGKTPDLAILDIRMPEMSGIEVLKKIRKLKMKVKVCILTNYPYPQYRKKCMEEGADYFFSKTEDFKKIDTVIADMLKETVNPDGI